MNEPRGRPTNKAVNPKNEQAHGRTIQWTKEQTKKGTRSHWINQLHRTAVQTVLCAQFDIDCDGVSIYINYDSISTSTRRRLRRAHPCLRQCRHGQCDLRAFHIAVDVNVSYRDFSELGWQNSHHRDQPWLVLRKQSQCSIMSPFTSNSFCYRCASLSCTFFFPSSGPSILIYRKRGYMTKPVVKQAAT